LNYIKNNNNELPVITMAKMLVKSYYRVYPLPT